MVRLIQYDTHVPLLFYGWNIKKDNLTIKRKLHKLTNITQMLKITMPNSSDGEGLVGGFNIFSRIFFRLLFLSFLFIGVYFI